jgi:hypothetical protein
VAVQAALQGGQLVDEGGRQAAADAGATHIQHLGSGDSSGKQEHG